MKFLVYQKMLKLIYCPSNSRIDGKIDKAYKKFLFIFNSPSKPTKGEIIYFKENKWVVTNVIRIPDNGDGSNEFFILEVMEYNDLHYYGRNYSEYMPLVVDIDESI